MTDYRMALVQENQKDITTKLDGFRLNGMYTDITIQCEGKVFCCHRILLAAASEYFERMLKMKCKETISGTVDLGDNVTAAILEEVLTFVYTGDANITPLNILALLVVSDYFEMPGLEKLCLQFVVESGFKPVVDLLDLLHFAHATSNRAIMTLLENCNMTTRLKQLFKTDDYLDMPADLFALIISKLWRSPSVDALINPIHKWITHAPADRRECSETLLQLISARCRSEMDCAGKYPLSAEMAEARSNLSSTQASMYLYVENGYLEKVFSIQPSGSVRLSSYGPASMIDLFRCVFVPECGLYKFNYFNRHTSWFRLSASISVQDRDQDVSLKSPPIHPATIDVCNYGDRGLYLLHRSATLPDVRASAGARWCKREWSWEEIASGIYFYNFELDDWYAVPAPTMTERYESCLSIVDDQVYVVGGAGSAGCVQAYDGREGVWRSIPRASYEHFNPQACALDNQLYVGSSWSDKFERYHPKAGRWEPIVKPHPFNQIQRLLPYGGYVCAVDTDLTNYVECFNTHRGDWTLLRTTDYSSSPHISWGRVLDAVVGNFD